MGKYKTTVTKKDGTKVSGYIEDGKSYYDDGTSISAGDSVVDAQGKTWTKGGASNTASSVDSVNMINQAIAQNNSTSSTSKRKVSQPSNYIERSAESQKIAQNAQYQNAYEKVLASLDSERAKTKGQYNDARNQADTDNKISTKNYFENVANRGQTNSGSTSQGELALKIAGQNNQSNLISQEAEKLADINRRESEAESDYLYNVIASNSNIDAQKYQNLLEQYRLDEENAVKAEKEAFEREIATVTQYYNDYTAEIQRREAVNPSDPLLPYLRMARQEKINEINEKAEKTRKEELERQREEEKLALEKAEYMAEYGDFSGLKALGINSTGAEQKYALDLALKKADINSKNKEIKKIEDKDEFKSTDFSIANYINRALGKNVIEYNEDMKAYQLAGGLDLTYDEKEGSYKTPTEETKTKNIMTLDNNQIYNWYKDPIIQNVLMGVTEKSISPAEGKQFLLNLGYSMAEIERVNSYTFEKEGE